MPAPPPLRCAVLAWGLCPETAEPRWLLIFANGDEAQARAAAREWLERNPEGTAQLLIAQPEGRASMVTKVEWK